MKPNLQNDYTTTGSLMQTARDFIYAMFGDPEQPQLFVTIPEAPDAAGKTIQDYMTLDQALPWLQKANISGAGVFVTINETDGQGRRKSNIRRVRALFVDLDEGDPEQLGAAQPAPHVIVSSSPGKYHAYWLVSDCPLVGFRGAQQALAARFGGDPVVCDLPRVMRLPGFDHLKDEPHAVELYEVNPEPAYTMEQLADLITPPQPEPAPAPTPRPQAGVDKYLAKAIQGEIDKVTSATEGSRNATLNSAAFALGTIPEMDQATATEQLRWAAAQVGLNDTEIIKTIRSGWESGRERMRQPLKPGNGRAAANTPQQDTPHQHRRHQIIIKTLGYTETLDQARQSLQHSPDMLFIRNGAIVRIVEEQTPTLASKTKISRPVGAKIIKNVDAHALREYLERAADYYRLMAGDEMKPARPPLDMAREILASPHKSGLHPLRAISSIPLLRLDGTYCMGGYDAQTGVYVDAPGDWMPAKRNAGKEEAAEAIEFIEHTFRHFPFEDAISKSVLITGLVTARMRAVLPTSPGIFISATTAGSGKSLIVDCISILVTGNSASVVEFSNEDGEFPKRLDACLMAGDQNINIDNVEGVLKGAALCSTLTQESRRVRVLGASKMETVPCVAFITATGNNVEIRGDLARRVLLCRLNPNMERPETRKIDQNIRIEVTENRALLLYHIDNIIMAHINEGSPDMGLVPLGSFEVWSRVVRNAVVFAGRPDPTRSQDAIRADDTHRQDTAELLAVWHDYLGDRKVAVRDLLHHAAQNEIIKEALDPICSRHGELDSRKLGYWLRQRRDSINSGYKLLRTDGKVHGVTADGKTTATVRWWVERVEG